MPARNAFLGIGAGREEALAKDFEGFEIGFADVAEEEAVEAGSALAIGGGG